MSARVDATLLGRVLELWNLGHSAGKIAEQLGLTRNQAMGMVHRARLRGFCPDHAGVNFKLGPTNRHRTYKRHKRVILRAAPGFKAGVALPCVKIVEPLLAPAEPVPCALPSGAVFDWYADGGCRFILNEDVRCPQWCNQPILRGPQDDGGGSWCREHRAIVYTRHIPKF